ncbi:MAG: hypothetical protein DI535_12230 [Citrobacter freundii]|nr:MAG: hypothetical protein DI535_12230 [Citrobacter freundii]
MVLLLFSAIETRRASGVKLIECRREKNVSCGLRKKKRGFIYETSFVPESRLELPSAAADMNPAQ